MAVMAQTQAVPFPRIRVDADRANGAYIAFLAFIVVIYSMLPVLVPATDALAPGKVVIALATLALAWSCILGRRKLRLGAVAGGPLFYAFFAIVILSPLWSLWPKLSVDTAGESVKFIAGFIVALNVLDTRKRIRTATAVIVLCSLFPAIGSILNYISGEHLVEGTRAAWIGSYGNPNFVAYTMVVSTPLALALRETSPRHSLQRWMWLGIIGVMAAAVFVTGSRGGFLGLAAVVLLWFARGLVKGRIAIGAGMALAAAIFLTPTSPLSREDTHENLSGQVDASAQGRIDAFRTAVNMVEANPILGVGAGAFVVGYDKYAPGDAGPARAAHNSFALIAAELGVPALLIFIAAIVAAFVALGRTARAAPWRAATVARGVQTALFGFCVCSMVGGYAFTWPLYFCAGIAAAIVLRERRAA
jgi:putative inorganic carbon (hco3(-)) transporter